MSKLFILFFCPFFFGVCWNSFPWASGYVLLAERGGAGADRHRNGCSPAGLVGSDQGEGELVGGHDEDLRGRARYKLISWFSAGAGRFAPAGIHFGAMD